MLYKSSIGNLLSVAKAEHFYINVPFMSREVIIMARGRPPTCPACGSHRSQKKGVRVTKMMGVRKIRLCKDCGKKFTPKHQKPTEEVPPEE